MKNNQKRAMTVRVHYADDPQRAEAALEILRQGFSRGLLKLAAQQKSNAVKEGEI